MTGLPLDAAAWTRCDPYLDEGTVNWPLALPWLLVVTVVTLTNAGTVCSYPIVIS